MPGFHSFKLLYDLTGTQRRARPKYLHHFELRWADDSFLFHSSSHVITFVITFYGYKTGCQFKSVISGLSKPPHQSRNIRLNEPAPLMRLIASAIMVLRLMQRIRLQDFAASLKGIVSVTTISSSKELLMLSMALPDSTG